MIAPSTPTQWVLHPRRDPDAALELARVLGAPAAVAHVLVNRGVTTVEAARRFLEPTLDDVHDPMLMLDMERAVARIRLALERRELVRVYGDYDVDGITATFLLHHALAEHLGAGDRVDFDIPLRAKEGYGLSVAAIDKAHRDGRTLVVTVDCGITAVEAVERARELGIDVVITDHHPLADALPPAHAVVDPMRPDCPYPFKALAGVGVAFKLVQALMRGRGGIERASQYLDVVALGTIADVVPLVGENRVLARLGLERLRGHQRVGLRVLAEEARVDLKGITSGQVAFILAPRINAAGRMGDATLGVELLNASSTEEANDLVGRIAEHNDKRRETDGEVLKEALEMLAGDGVLADRRSIVLWSERWHSGVLGIVASRLVERFRCPVVLVSLRGDAHAGRGSGRSLPGLDLNRLLGDCGDLLEGWGGHAFAAGLTVRSERLPELRDRIDRLVRERLSAEDCVQRLEVDAELRFAECDLELVGWLERLGPHGLENPEPLFCAADVEVVEARRVGSVKPEKNGPRGAGNAPPPPHLRLELRDATGHAEAIGFRLGDLKDAVQSARRCDFVFVPTRNEWLGQTRVQLKVKGVRVP